MRDSIISIAIVLTMLIPNSGSAFANTQSENNKSGNATYIDISSGKTDGKNKNPTLNKPSQPSNSGVQNQPNDNDMGTLDSLNTESPQENVGMNEGTIDTSDFQQGNQNANDDTETSIFVWIALFAAAMSIAFTAICFYKLRLFEKERKAKTKSHRRPSQLDDVLERLNSLEDQISNLNSNVSVSSRQYRPVPQPSRNYVSDQTQRQSQSSNHKRYACTIMGEGFPIDSISDHSESEAIAILTVNGNKASFIINTDESAQRRLLKNFNYSVGRISNIIEKIDNASRIVTVIPGQAELRGEEWFIVKKASVKLV